MMIKEYLKYSMNEKTSLEIESVKGSKFEVEVLQYNSEKVFYTFLGNGEKGQIKFENIKKCKFKDKEVEKNFYYSQINKQYNRTDIKSVVENFARYYFEIFELLQQREKEGTFEYEHYDFKKTIYQMIFENLHTQKDNLLFSYFTGEKSVNKELNECKFHSHPIILLQQSNLSQKKSIEAALNNRISIIEGPPGTGKTTTILSIIANLVYENKKVVVVSKNNSAINNVVEELEQMPIPDFFIRLGKKEVMDSLSYALEEKMMTYEQQLKNISFTTTEAEKEKINILFNQLTHLEEQLNELILHKNQLSEFKNQYRHLIKRREAYDFSVYEHLIKKINRKSSSSKIVKQELDRLAELLVKRADGQKIGFVKRILMYFRWRMTLAKLKSEGIVLQSLLEEKFLNIEIEDLEKKLEKENLCQLQKKIREIYKYEYIELSKKLLLESLKKKYDSSVYQNIYSKIKENDNEAPIKRCKDDLIGLYPVILTTVDAVLSNFYSFFNNGAKIDCIIIDEASQCDILSALPILYLAKQLIVVGDNKQLPAIINLSSNGISNKVQDGYDFTNESFLSTISKTIKPVSNLLLEHYRCDYKIINYCNRYFYDNQLIIYKDASDDAMILIDDDKGKYAELESGSFVNSREIVTIDDAICSKVEGKFIITPFRKQASKLMEKYNKKQCGTIHTFQGKGENEVYFCTVLNHIDKAINHLTGKNNLFSKELINVAVSRAKTKFVLVTDVKFFKEYDVNTRNLIEYIEAYGEVIPDKTVCIFDYLYQQMKTYTVVENCDNIFEKTVKEYLDRYTQQHPEYHAVVKLPLASVVTDKKFLEVNPAVKQFIMNNAHLDFTIYDNRIGKPIAVIELDGKFHKTPEQIDRDKKKNFALKHMSIKLWRLKSKEAVTKEQFDMHLNELLSN
ncbi:AAA domain-containing protein [Clostridium beijerinckii]|uniref:AAA domain-containing protein n=1 Tax=Clostridium beijerinckii TaxID=1520 RepID=UPI00047E6578|nr:AAA domain-containing protein [Clostridium beijerinckii]